jgi:acyl-coenzyme A thioesterase PaaI-like protein
MAAIHETEPSRKVMGHHQAVPIPASHSSEEYEAELQDYVSSAPITSSLRSSQEITSSRTLLSMQPAHASAHLTHTSLSTPTTIPVPPIVFSSSGGRIWVFYKLGPALAGHHKVVHGGLSATLLDEVMAVAAFPLVESRSLATAELTVMYKKPLPTESCVLVKGEQVKREGRKVWMEGSIEDAVGGKVFVEARALYIEPRKDAGMTNFA